MSQELSTDLGPTVWVSGILFVSSQLCNNFVKPNVLVSMTECQNFGTGLLRSQKRWVFGTEPKLCPLRVFLPSFSGSLGSQLSLSLSLSPSPIFAFKKMMTTFKNFGEYFSAIHTCMQNLGSMRMYCGGNL